MLYLLTHQLCYKPVLFKAIEYHVRVCCFRILYKNTLEIEDLLVCSCLLFQMLLWSQFWPLSCSGNTSQYMQWILCACSCAVRAPGKGPWKRRIPVLLLRSLSTFSRRPAEGDFTLQSVSWQVAACDYLSDISRQVDEPFGFKTGMCYKLMFSVSRLPYLH